MKTPEDICPEFPEWPERWHGLDEDIPYGEGILTVIRPFVEYLIQKGLKKKTIRNHMANLWLLGGEIIRDVSLHEEYQIPPLDKVKQAVDSEGGPYCRHISSEWELKAFDATCRQLHRFLTAANL